MRGVFRIVIAEAIVTAEVIIATGVIITFKSIVAAKIIIPISWKSLGPYGLGLWVYVGRTA